MPQIFALFVNLLGDLCPWWRPPPPVFTAAAPSAIVIGPPFSNLFDLVFGLIILLPLHRGRRQAQLTFYSSSPAVQVELSTLSSSVRYVIILIFM